MHAPRLALPPLFAALLAGGCSTGPPPPDGPNVLWIVWDTVRADRLSLYGYEEPTTPLLDEWAKGARVFEDCVSAASSTTPSHAAMFTGLQASEHGANNSYSWLEDDYDTIAELFQDKGYRTFLFAANPHVSSSENFDQGFDVERHPWDKALKPRAVRVVRDKLAANPASELVERIGDDAGGWTIKAAGELGEESLVRWLEKSDGDRPFFAFLNYMEAHRPYIPRMENQQRMMTEEQIERARSFRIGWADLWAYNFGMLEYPEEDLEAVRGIYDATLSELDDLFASLRATLQAAGHLDDTVIVLTADHGEHLGEQHMFDHQYTVYAPAIRVPLVVHYPKRFAPGRDARPVQNFDLFETLRELAELEPPAQGRSVGVSLLAPDAERVRLAEYPSVFQKGIDLVRAARPGFDPKPFERRLKALHHDGYKLIRGEDGKIELYHLATDPLEESDLAGTANPKQEELERRLVELEARLRQAPTIRSARPGLDEEQRRILEGLGYGGR